MKSVPTVMSLISKNKEKSLEKIMQFILQQLMTRRMRTQILRNTPNSFLMRIKKSKCQESTQVLSNKLNYISKEDS